MRPDWDTLAEQVHRTARAGTPPPAGGLAAIDHPTSSALPGRVDLTAGRTYTDGLRQGGA